MGVPKLRQFGPIFARFTACRAILGQNRALEVLEARAVFGVLRDGSICRDLCPVDGLADPRLTLGVAVPYRRGLSGIRAAILCCRFSHV